MAMAVLGDIPVGFRFRPTEDEVFDHYLSWRNLEQESQYFGMYVPDIDITMLDPRELQDKFKDRLSYQRNEKEWWFFSRRTWKRTTTRTTGSGRWSSTCKDKEIRYGGEKQMLGIMKTFAFHRRLGSSYTRDNWILHEYHLSNWPLPDKETYFVLCQLNEKNDKAKNKTGGEVGHSGSSGIDQQEVQHTNGEISSQVRPRKRLIESTDAPSGPVNEGSIFPDLQQDYFRFTDHPQSGEVSFNIPQSVESLAGSLALEPLQGSNRGITSSDYFDFDGDILNYPLEDQTALWSYEEPRVVLQGVPAANSLGASPFESSLNQAGLFRDPSSSTQQNTLLLRQRAGSTKPLSGVVPAEEDKTSAENRNASNSSASAESFPKVAARVVKKEPTAENPSWKRTSIVKIEEDEKLAQETKQKLRLTSGSELKCQNQNSLPFPPAKYLANLVVGIVMGILFCWQMLYL